MSRQLQIKDSTHSLLASIKEVTGQNFNFIVNRAVYDYAQRNGIQIKEQYNGKNKRNSEK